MAFVSSSLTSSLPLTSILSRGQPLVCPRRVSTRHPLHRVTICKADGNEPNITPDSDGAPSPRPGDDALLRDAEKLRAKQRQRQSASSSTDPVGSFGSATGGGRNSLQSVIDTVLIVNFFLVVALLLWLGVALVPHFASKNDALLDPWLALWKPFIQPVLGVLMLGTIAQGTLAFFSTRD